MVNVDHVQADEMGSSWHHVQLKGLFLFCVIMLAVKTDLRGAG